MKVKIKDYLFGWRDWKKCECECRVRIFAGRGEFEGKTVIVATDLGKGNSVTNEAEHLATLLSERERIAPENLVFIEHYEDSARFEETFDLVEFEWDPQRDCWTSPRWRHLTKEQLRRTGVAGFEVEAV